SVTQDWFILDITMSLSTEVEELLHTPLTFLAEDELQEAFTIVTTLLEVFPEEKNRFKSTLEGILATWGRLLERSGQFDKLFACYHKALIVFCDHEGILSNLGAHLLRAGYMEKASEYFHESLKVNSNYLPAQRNLETVRSYMVERWHFRMLNDNIRNNGFREAIIKKIKKGFDCVLDIGTGTGILSLFAIEAGAQNVYACDSNETMINISRQVFERNNAIDKVKIIHKLSNDIKIPDNIPERSIFIQDGGNGLPKRDNMLQLTLSRMEESNLSTIGLTEGDSTTKKEETGRRNCKEHADNDKLRATAKNVVSRPFGWKKVNFGRQLYNDSGYSVLIVSLVVTETMDIGLLGENILQTLIHAWDSLLLPCSDEAKRCLSDVKTGCVIPHSADVWVAVVECPYIGLKHRVLHYADQEMAENVPHPEQKYDFDCHDFIKLNLFTSDGCDYDSMELGSLPQGYRFLTEPCKVMEVNFNDRNGMEQLLKGESGKNEIKFICNVEGQADAVVLWFDLKLDEDIELTSSPMDAINRAKCWDQAIFPLQIPIRVKELQSLSMNVNCGGGRISIKLYSFNETNDKSETSCSDSNSTLLHKEVDHSIFVKTNSVPDSIKSIKNYPVSKEIISFLNDKCWINSLNEMLHIFLQSDIARNCTDILDISPFPLFGLAFLKNRQQLYGICPVTLTCVANEEQDVTAIMSTAEANNISRDNLHIVHGEIDDILSPSPKFDLILLTPVETTGKLHEKNITYLPFFNLIKKPSGVVVPIEIKICSQLIYSQWLSEVSFVQSNDRVCGYDVAPLINEYKISEHLDFTLSTLKSDIYSEVMETPAVTTEELMSNLVEPWTCELIVTIKRDGVINALPYWFKIKLFHGMSEVTTYSPTSFANQATILFEPHIEVKTGDTMRVAFTCHQGLMNAVITKVD
ncbi:Protein arginine N-methyltransferase 7, partial [Gryllus bimaculatus]